MMNRTAATPPENYTTNGAYRIVQNVVAKLGNAQALVAEAGRTRRHDAEIAPSERNLKLFSEARFQAEDAINSLRVLRQHQPKGAGDDFDRTPDFSKITLGLNKLDSILRRGSDLSKAEIGTKALDAFREFENANESMHEMLGNR